jgi:5-methylcytosine-specific restriction protein A
MKIDADMIKIAYSTAKEVYCNKAIGLAEGAEFLVDKCAWTYSSAIGYLHVFGKMINGDLYTRTINGLATQYYLQNILDDFGYDILQKALISVKSHIEYYKNLGPINNIEKIYDFFVKIQPKNISYYEFEEDEKYYLEGKAQQVFVNIYERDKVAREKCLEHYGYKCFACGLLLSNIYGKIAEKFIHVHHLIELSKIKIEYNVDPIKDLRPLCPNCHAIIHREKTTLTIDDIINLIKENKK